MQMQNIVVRLKMGEWFVVGIIIMGSVMFHLLKTQDRLWLEEVIPVLWMMVELNAGDLIIIDSVMFHLFEKFWKYQLTRIFHAQ